MRSGGKRSHHGALAARSAMTAPPVVLRWGRVAAAPMTAALASPSMTAAGEETGEHIASPHTGPRPVAGAPSGRVSCRAGGQRTR